MSAIEFGDPSVRPQDDMFAHVNGGFVARAEIPPDRAEAGAWHEADDRVRRDLEHIVTGLPPDQPSGSPEQVVGEFYASFMDLPRLAAQGDDLLLTLLAEATRVDTLAELGARFGLLMRHQLDSLLRFAVVANPADPRGYLPHWQPGGIGLPDRSYYLDPGAYDLLAAYGQHVARMLGMVGWEDPEEAAKTVVGLETELARAQAELIEARDVADALKPMRLSAAAALAPGLDWPAMLEQLDLGGAGDPVVLLAQPDYLEAVSHLVRLEMLPRWRPWLAWRVVQGLADYGPAPIANAQWEFNDTVLRGLEQPEPRSARVLEYVEHFLGDAMGQLYARRRYTAKVQARIGALVGNVLAEYAQTLAGVPWMSEVTRKRAIEKLGWLGARIGAPTRWHDYSELFIAPDDLLGNALRAASHLTESQVDKLVGNENGEEWQIPPHVVNAYYDIHRNEIVFPAAFLQPPYFDPDADDASNYGAIGAIVAHEISHGFDARGSRFDGRGRVRGWWLPGDAQAYAEIRARLVGQLADELGEGAELKADEAMSDLAGLAVAYRAWLRTTEGDVDEAAARRFFTSYAGIWRTVQRPEEARRRAATDPHPPPRTRCNLALTNFDPFHAAFGVKPSDGMWLRPGLRVRLW